jgi:hypothetical protein
LVKTVGVGRAVEKWKSRASVAVEDYKKGIAAPRNPWSSAASAAASTFQQAVTAGDIGDRYARGVTAAGDAKWSGMAQNKGSARYTQGVTLGAPYYQSGISDVLSVIEGVTPPPRGPAGSPGNWEIPKAIGDALHAMKVGRG